jgi:tRNA (guanine37-N1)-methyltransferase
MLAPPIYTRPRSYKGWDVPEVLFSGNFPKIEKWREKEAIRNTKIRRPDLLDE